MDKVAKEEFHRKKAGAWVSQHLGRRYGVSPDRVKHSDKLIDWGFTDEGHYADLTRAFNEATHTDADWYGSAVTPPELLKGSGGKTARGAIGKSNTVDDLVNYLASTTAKSHLTAGDIENILLSRLASNGSVVDRNSSLSGVNPSQNEANLINLDCGSSQAISFYTECAARPKPAPTVANVANCMFKKLGSAE